MEINGANKPQDRPMFPIRCPDKQVRGQLVLILIKPELAVSDTLQFSSFFYFFVVLVFPFFVGFSKYSYRVAHPNVPLENLFFYGASPERFSTPPNILGQLQRKNSIVFFLTSRLTQRFPIVSNPSHL